MDDDINIPGLAAVQLDDPRPVQLTETEAHEENHEVAPISEAEPPRKRQRTEELEGAPSLASALMSSHTTTTMLSAEALPAPVRDETYYMEGADCVIRVENTLFRVHRFILARDCSAFQDMFSLPPPASGEGSSDDHPIILFGERARDFRLLISVLYALPPELQVYTSTHAYLPHLLTLAHMTHKYHFITTEAWALAALHDAFARAVALSIGSAAATTYVVPHAHTALTSRTFARTLEIALRTAHARLTMLAADSWARLVQLRTLPALNALAFVDAQAQIDWETQVPAIAPREAESEAGVARALRTLRGVAHYAVLMDIQPDFTLPIAGPIFASGSSINLTSTPFANPGHVPTTADEAGAEEEEGEGEVRAPALTPAQKRRLLSGHFALVRRWERLCAGPPPFSRPEGCTYHVRGCVETWASAWREAAATVSVVKDAGGADVLGRLASVERMMEGNADVRVGLTPACRREALLAARRQREEVTEWVNGVWVDLAGA